MNTSTPEGRAQRIKVIKEQEQKKALAHLNSLQNMYEKTGDKSIGWAIYNLTGQGDNFPGPDSE